MLSLAALCVIVIARDLGIRKEKPEVEFAEEAKEDEDLNSLPSEESVDQYLPKRIYTFLRPQGKSPKHLTLTSPFANCLTDSTSRLYKPRWYKMPTRQQIRLFRELVHMVEKGRTALIPFEPFAAVLKGIAPSITAYEVYQVLEHLDRDEPEELDFVEFIFLLVNNPIYDEILRTPRNQAYLIKNRFSPRQRLFYSLVVFFTLTQTQDDIDQTYRAQEEYYDVLDMYMASTRQELDAEDDLRAQRDALLSLDNITPGVRSPYLAFPKFKVAPKQLEKKSSKKQLVKPHPVKKPLPKPKEGQKKVKSSKKDLERKEEDRILALYEEAKIPGPLVSIHPELVQTSLDSDYEDYVILENAAKKVALDDYYDRLRAAVLIFRKRFLETELEKGFPNENCKQRFLDIYNCYVDNFLILHPWIPKKK